MFYFDIKNDFLFFLLLDVGLGWYIRAIFIDSLFFFIRKSF